jgi:hypothetical protein
VRAGTAVLPQTRRPPHAGGGCRRLSPAVTGCHRRRFRTTRRDPAIPRSRAPKRPSAQAPKRPRSGAADILCPPAHTRCGSPISPLCPPARDSSSSPSSWTPARAVSSAGPWRRIYALRWSMAALDRALQHRRPLAGVIHQSDHGSQ